jgi:hypothetical protein
VAVPPPKLTVSVAQAVAIETTATFKNNNSLLLPLLSKTTGCLIEGGLHG